MEKDLSDYRKSYEKFELLLSDVPSHPIELFEKWFAEVDKRYPENENNAMTISTTGKDGFPKSRVVLLKKFSKSGFIFFTNYKSEKGEAIALQPKVCLSFFWQGVEQQVIIKGVAEKISKEESDAYFKSRPRGSQLGAWASQQSTVVPSRDFLEKTLNDLEKHHENKNIERPDFWGGYIIKPQQIEFWQGRPNRLHDRVKYTLGANNVWSVDRLSP